MKIVFKNFIKLTLDEQKKIIEIRNEKNIRKWMMTEEIIKLEDHLQWIQKLEKDTTINHYAIFYENILIGSLNFTLSDKKSNIAKWGVYFKYETNPIIISFCVFIFIRKLFEENNIEKIISKVKKENINAYNFNKSFGFIKKYTQNEYNILELTKKDWKESKIQKLSKRLSKINYNFIE